MGLSGRPGGAGTSPSTRPPPDRGGAPAALGGPLVGARGAPPTEPLTARPPVTQARPFRARSVTRGGTGLALLPGGGDRDVESHWRGGRARRGNRDAGLRRRPEPG